MTLKTRSFFLGLGLMPFLVRAASVPATPVPGIQDLDAKVRAFLDERQGHWRDMNIPSADGRILFDLIVSRGYKRALEIGTSTGHSGTWIAWALSKTGGKLLTLEIDGDRHDQAARNFRASGLADRVEARLGDAHAIVPALEGPFDFVFCDADKDWYIEYFKAMAPKLAPGGCFAAHNVSERGRGWNREYLEYVRGQAGFTTTIDSRGSASLALSIRK
jgi:caffeoyl-CoA O-methyltransferase